MAHPSIPVREHELIAFLSKLAAERARAEEDVSRTHRSARDRLEQTTSAERRRIDQHRDRRVAEAESDRTRAHDQIRSTYAAEKTRLESTYQSESKAAETAYRQGLHRSQTAHDEARWQTLALFDAARESANKEFEALSREHVERAGVASRIESEATALLVAHRSLIDPAPAGSTPSEAVGSDHPRNELDAEIETLDHLVDRFHRLGILKVLRIDAFLLIQFFVATAIFFALVSFVSMPVAAIVAAIVVVVEAIGLQLVLRSVARKKVAEIAQPMRTSLERLRRLVPAARDSIAREAESKRNALESKRDADLQTMARLLESRKTEFTNRRDVERTRLESTYPPLLVEAKQVASSALAQVGAVAEREITEAHAEHAAAAAALEESHRAALAEIESTHERDWNRLALEWREGMARFRAELQEIESRVAHHFPDPASWEPARAARENPPGLLFGRFTVEVDRIADAIPDDPRLRADAPGDFTLPAMLAWDDRPSLILRAADEGRARAVESLQAAMFRLLIAFPPSRARFTIVDPVGLGQNFASFMHLADHDELLINHRIWTDPQQIEQRLADLTDHMENVIQTYLRNDYPTIEHYNAQAGEVAEPYRFLVIADFPHGLTETAIRRVVSIAKSGPRCGVHLLMSIDMDQPVPHGFSIKELEPHAQVLVWKDGGFVWRDPRFEHHPLVLDTTPSLETAGPLLDALGKAAKAARRVEVPFEVVAPADDRWWTASSRSGIDLPLGRAGATKLQHLALGRGTSQHVLIAGKTGSGKSTFLHALITNVALRYSPDEVELYLIDFKKGVEFKTYAVHDLPHARVVAVESEREFGLSVLQRLDQELKARGDRFRDAGVQDLAGFRGARPDQAMPRILLLVDEFQEFFVEDDKLAQEAALLLDRLVRQGRAFGIHVHLGSQTLSGAYSLARSTLGQMAVRIALQCSESDAHLILSEENTAARLLTRPGEAIYNDANGLVEGNHIFQIVWLGDELRERYLDRLHRLAQERGFARTSPMIVFEGNTPAEIDKNSLLRRLMQSDRPVGKRSRIAWLGDAIAIKDPTSVTFEPQGGSNLLLIGQQEEAALGILSAVLSSLALQDDPGAARFILFDGTPADSTFHGSLDQAANSIGHLVQRGTTRTLPNLIDSLTEEIERRRSDDSIDSAPIYLVVHDLGRFRELRKKEDDFGFGSYGGDSSAPPNPAKQFTTILREGPVVNVHTIVWCDSVSNLNRTLDRQAIGEFELRVLFQMSANDSSNLIDSPAAGRLGANRAYFYSEEQGRLEKFRPYGMPSPTFLREIETHMGTRPRVELPPTRSAEIDSITEPSDETTPFEDPVGS